MHDELSILRDVAVNRVVTTAVAEKAGVSRFRLVAMAKGGDLRHLARGAWTTEQPIDDADLHLLRTVAVRGRQRGDSAATAHSALLAADAAVGRGLVSPRQFEVAAAEVPMGTRGSRAVCLALAEVDGRHESPGETRAATVCRELGYVLEPQVWIGPWRVDFLIAGTTVVLEFDG